jgi:hypothetical protein
MVNIIERLLNLPSDVDQLSNWILAPHLVLTGNFYSM